MKGFSFSIRTVVVFVLSMVVILIVSALFTDILATPKTLAEDMIQLNFGKVSIG